MVTICADCGGRGMNGPPFSLENCAHSSVIRLDALPREDREAYEALSRTMTRAADHYRTAKGALRLRARAQGVISAVPLPEKVTRLPEKVTRLHAVR